MPSSPPPTRRSSRVACAPVGINWNLSGPLRRTVAGRGANVYCDWVDGVKATGLHCWSGPFANNELSTQQCEERFSSSSRNGKEIGRKSHFLPSIGR